MTLFRNKYRIETTRLPGWDYSWNGYYFVTVCIQDHFPLLGVVENGEMKLNQFGQIVHDCWHDLPNHYCNIVLDAFCVMPNHVHGIVIINNELLNEGPVETGLRPVCEMSFQINKERKGFVETGLRPVSTTNKRHSLFEIMRAFKSFSARRINEKRQTSGLPVWQSRFHDHIIRNDDSLAQIRQYIIENPKVWCADKFYVDENL